jgi:hypothetical protein
LAYLNRQEYLHSTEEPKADNRSVAIQAYADLQYAFNSAVPSAEPSQGPENFLDADGYVGGWNDSLRSPERKWL